MPSKNDLTQVISRDELHKLLEEYCSISKLASICLNADGEALFEAGFVEGVTEEDNWKDVILNADISKKLLDDVGEGSLEDIRIKHIDIPEMENGLWMAGLAVRVRNELILSWLILADGGMDEASFISKLDFLRDTCCSIYIGRFIENDAESEGGKCQSGNADITRAYDMMKAMTNILQLLDSGNKIEQVMQDWLEITREFLGAPYGEIFRINADGRTMDILAECTGAGQIPVFDEKKDVPVYGFADSDTPLIISSEQINKDSSKEVADLGISAIMILPLIKRPDGAGSMFVAFEYRKSTHSWTMEEIKFASDAGRVIQNALVSRISRNSVAGSLRALEAILNNVGASVYLTSRQSGKVIFFNNMLKATFADEWEDGSLQKMVESKEDEKSEEGVFEIFHPTKARWYEVMYKNLEWVDGSDAKLYSLYDVTDRKLYQKKIEQQAFTDFLTGLFNRMCCERDLARLIDEAKNDNTKGALVYLDLDDFKHINDGLGHQYGDVLLKSISSALKSIVGIEDTCYRMGGDEFVILIPPKSFDRFEIILKEIRNVFARPWYLKETDYYCTTSMGVVSFPDLGDTVQDLIKKADIAMYEAKKSGKNRMARYNAGQDSASGRRLDMEKNMRDAEVSDYSEFQVYFQPIVDVENGEERCIGAEALVRWDSKQLGFISPGDFIPLAEYLGLINPIGDHVLKRACVACKSWNDKGFDYMKVNVNLSVVQLLQNNIIDLVKESIEESGINPKNLCLEVTESLAINDMPRMIGILTRIKELGVSIALDDFGTGYSSLNHIREIPFDIIKVDQSFVVDLAENAYSQAFVKMVAELAETIGVKICVEGIETPDQYKVVTGFKVKYIQGYYFDKPLKQAEFEAKYVRDWG